MKCAIPILAVDFERQFFEPQNIHIPSKNYKDTDEHLHTQRHEIARATTLLLKNRDAI